MQLRERIILNSEMADIRAFFNSAVETSLLELLGMSRVLSNEKVKAISTLSRTKTRFAYSTETLPPLSPHAIMLLVPIRFSLWRVDYALEGSMFWLSKCDFSRLFHTERSWLACMTGALWAKRGERDISRGARHEREVRHEGKRKIKRLFVVHCSACSTNARPSIR